MPAGLKVNLALDPLELKPTCPAATPLGGPPVFGPSVLCNAIRLDKQATEDTTAAREGKAGAVLYGRDDRGFGGDPESVVQLCCGDYQVCPIWRAEKRRHWEAQAELRGESAAEPEAAETTRDLIDRALDEGWEFDAVRDPSVCGCGRELRVTASRGLVCPTGVPGHRGIPVPRASAA